LTAENLRKKSEFGSQGMIEPNKSENGLQDSKLIRKITFLLYGGAVRFLNLFLANTQFHLG